MMPMAVVLLSGGLDSATTLAVASREGFLCYALSVDYGQRHAAELAAAKALARQMGVQDHRLVQLDMRQFGGSALTDPGLAVPTEPSGGIPITYVPARNTVMLSLAMAWAEVLEADAIFIGVNAVDYSGYPDCRPAFIRAFQGVADVASKRAVEGRPVTIEAPLISLSKADIIRIGNALGVDFARTVSCYQADAEGFACGRCDACRIRREGFAAAGIPDATRYQG